LKSVLIALTIVIAAFAALLVCDHYFLWKPSLEGKCGPAPDHPHLAQFRGEVVGKSLPLFQYRWIRRRFKAVGTTLSLVRSLPSTEYEGNIVRHGENAGEIVIDQSGKFDFGALQPGEYELSVRLPGEDAFGWGFVIDKSARATEVLIDASPAYYCSCCGWNFELR
jgi:hypothetical protein